MASASGGAGRERDYARDGAGASASRTVVAHGALARPWAGAILSGSDAMKGDDWHPADIAAALKKRGHSLAALSIQHGYHRTAVGKASKVPWTAVERIIADALGQPPHTIWPSRYDEDGAPLPRRGRTSSLK